MIERIVQGSLAVTVLVECRVQTLTQATTFPSVLDEEVIISPLLESGVEAAVVTIADFLHSARGLSCLHFTSRIFIAHLKGPTA